MSSGHKSGGHGGRQSGGYHGDHPGGRGQNRGRRDSTNRGGQYRGRGNSANRGGQRGGGGPGGRPTFEPVQVFTNPNPQNPKVTQLENDVHPESEKLPNLNKLQLTSHYPVRPGYGTRGTKIELTANYVELVLPENLVLHRFDIKIEPEVTGRKCFQVVKLLLNSAELAKLQGKIVTDFRSTLFSLAKFQSDEIKIKVPYTSEGEDEPAAGATTYSVRLVRTHTLNMDVLVDYLISSNLSHTLGEKAELTQALNIFLNHHAKSTQNLVAIGSKTFSMSDKAFKADLGSGLEVIRGFFSSVRLASHRLLVNVNVSHGAFYKAGPLVALMNSYFGRNATLNVAALEKFLRLVRVRTTHLPVKRNKAGEVIPRVKTIFRLARKDDGQGTQHPPIVQSYGANAKQVYFWMGDEATSSSKPKSGAKEKGKPKGPSKGKTQPGKGTHSIPEHYISVFEFFRTKYNLVLKHPDLPVVNCGNQQNPVYLPAEVCIVLPGQSSKLKLDGRQTTEMIRHAVRKPWENAGSIVHEGIQTVGLDETANELMKTFGLKITPGLVKIPGRVLGYPQIVYKDSNSKEMQVHTSGGSWNMINIKFNTGASLKLWSYLVITFHGNNIEAQLENATKSMKEFGNALTKIGVHAAEPATGKILYLKHADDNVQGIRSTLQTAAKANLGLLYVILPEANIPLYKRIKTLADQEYGVTTVCSVATKLMNPRGTEQYMANIALKVNLKLGGINQKVQGKNLGILDADKTMVVGIDVTHPSPGSSPNAPSVSAMVASVDKYLGQWPATLRVQRARQENVDDLAKMLQSRLHLWRSKGRHAEYPENILIYRDGVSEGQYDMVLSQELPQLRRACEQMYPANKLPRFTVIICGKRHKTRFYPTTEANAEKKNENPQPGTVVDRGVTEVRNWDFFLQAHAAIKGTARPCHYYIVHDETFRDRYAKNLPPQFKNIADVVEDLTHNMCYLFGRATKAVSLCPPAYYADLACERARCYLANLFDTPAASENLSVTGQSATGGVSLPSSNDVQVHERLKDTMFYI